MQFIGRKSLAFIRQSVLNCNKMRYLSTTDQQMDGNSVSLESEEPVILSSLRPRLESIDVKRKRLLYQSRKRGILENDLILSTFAKKYLNEMNEKQLEMYDSILNIASNDWDLYYWSIGKKAVPKELDNEVMHRLIQHSKNNERQRRLRQPDI